MSNDKPVDKIIPIGRYKVRCISATFGFTSNNEDQLGLQLEIVEGDYKGRVMPYYGFFTEKTEEHTIKSMRALGWQGVDFRRLETIYSGFAQAVVEHEEDRDKTLRARVRWINSIGVAMANPHDAAATARLAQRMRGLAARIGGGGGGSGGSDGGSDAPPQGRQQRRDTRNTNTSEPPPWDDVPPPDDAPRGYGNGRGGGGSRYGR